MNSCYYESYGEVPLNEVKKACREKSAEVIVVWYSITPHEGLNLLLT